MTFRIILNLVTTIHRRILNNSNDFLRFWKDDMIQKWKKCRYFIIVPRIKYIISNHISGSRTKSCNHFSFVCFIFCIILFVFSLYVVSTTLSVSLVCPFLTFSSLFLTFIYSFQRLHWFFAIIFLIINLRKKNNTIIHNMTRTVAGLTTTPPNNKVVGWMVYGV